MSSEALGHVCPPSVVKWLNSPLRLWLQNPRKLFGSYVNTGDTVADLGCGGGIISVALAEMVGKSGKVYAVDFQSEMLEITNKLVLKKQLQDRIVVHQCTQNDLNLEGIQLVFVAALNVVHEIPDRGRFYRQVFALVRPGGVFLQTEPNGHVKAEQFEMLIREAQAEGFRPGNKFKSLWGKGVVFHK